MATSTNAIISRAAPHTIKKFELISNYVDGWARKILGLKCTPKVGQKKFNFRRCIFNVQIHRGIEKAKYPSILAS